MRHKILLAIAKNIVLEKTSKQRFRADINHCWKVTLPIIIGVGLYNLYGLDAEDAMTDLNIDTHEEYKNRLAEWDEIISFSKSIIPVKVHSSDRTVRIGHSFYSFDEVSFWADMNYPDLRYSYLTKTINKKQKIDWLGLIRDSHITTMMGIAKTSYRRIDPERKYKDIVLLRKIAMIQNYIGLHQKERFVN